MKQKTAVTKLMDYLLYKAFLNGNKDIINFLLSHKDNLGESEAKFKEQIYEAFVAGDQRGTGEIPFNCEQYYNQTYKP